MTRRKTSNKPKPNNPKPNNPEPNNPKPNNPKPNNPKPNNPKPNNPTQSNSSTPSKLPNPNSTPKKSPASSQSKSKKKKSSKKKASTDAAAKPTPQKTPIKPPTVSKKPSTHSGKKSTKKPEEISGTSAKSKASKSPASKSPASKSLASKSPASTSFNSSSLPVLQANKRKRSERAPPQNQESVVPKESVPETKQNQIFFVSDPSRVTSLLCDALLNSRVGVCDAHLHTTDNSIVPVSRSVLTVLNSYLASYACAVHTKSEEEHPPNFQCLPVSSQHLRHVLEFTYTNDCAFLRKLRSKHLWRKDIELPTVDTITDVILLAHAAHVCHTPQLSAWGEGTAGELVQKCPLLVCAALRTVLKSPTVNSEQLISTWLARIFAQPATFLGRMRMNNVPLDRQQNPAAPKGLSVLDLDANSFAKILAPDHHHHEYYFRAIYCWATRGYTDHSKAGPRWRNAKRLAQRIDFTKVSSKFLLGFVDSSGLIDEQNMASIYRMQLASKSNLPKSYGLSGSGNSRLGKRSRESRPSAVHPPQKKQATSQNPTETPQTSCLCVPRATSSSTVSQFQTVPMQQQSMLQQSMPQQHYPSTSNATHPLSFTHHVYPPIPAAVNTASGGQGAATHPSQTFVPQSPVVQSFSNTGGVNQHIGSGAVANHQVPNEATATYHGHQNQPHGITPAVQVSMPQMSTPIGQSPMFSNEPSHGIYGTQMDQDGPGQFQNTNIANASSSEKVPNRTTKYFGTSLCSAVNSRATGPAEGTKHQPSEGNDHLEAHHYEQGVARSQDESMSAAPYTPFQITTRQKARRIKAQKKAVKQEVKEEDVVIVT